MTDETKAREATAKANELLRELQETIDNTLAKVQEICDEAQIEVYWAPTGYGSGQTYFPKSWTESDVMIDDEWYGRWVSSSEQC